MVTILIKIKNKAILFEKIQGFVSIRHYILPYLISKDYILQNQLKIFNGILKDNKLSSYFIKNLFTFISDRILFRVVNEEKNILDNSQYIPEEGENQYQILKKRIINIYKSHKYEENINININDLKLYLPNEKEFALFLFDFFDTKNQILPLFCNLKGMNNFLSYYENHKLEFETREKINQLSNEETEIFYKKKNRKPVINIGFIGNKNSGKSTTIGHLLYNTGNINQNFFIKISNSANEIGFSSYKYSWLINNLWGERTYSKTIIYHINKFETKKYDFNLIDLPGDFHLIKNIIRGLSLADAIVFIVAAENENYENDHIKDYLIISYTMGIRQIIIAINKMDQTKDIKYSEKSFIKMKKNMINLCKNIGFNINNIQVISYSGYTGQNLVNKYEDGNILNKMDWYKGKTLLESLDEFKLPKRSFNGPLKISIFNSEKISGIGTVFGGKILSGTLNKNMELINCIPDFHKNHKQKCQSIEIHNNQIDEAIAGDIIGFNIKGVSKYVARKCRLVFTENEKNNLKNANNLRVKILMINKKATLRVGSDLRLFCYTLNEPVKILKIEYLIDGANKIIEKDPKEIKNGSFAIIIINLIKSGYNNEMTGYQQKKLIYFEKYIDNPFLGSFVLYNDGLIAVGNIKDIIIL